jgi:hypothetical protein
MLAAAAAAAILGLPTVVWGAEEEGPMTLQSATRLLARMGLAVVAARRGLLYSTLAHRAAPASSLSGTRYEVRGEG